MRRKTRRAARAAAALALAALVTVPAALGAQSAREVLETALERYEERMEGVQNYTVVQEAMGFESTQYFERVERDGHVLFVPRQQMGSEAARRGGENPYVALEQLADRATLQGTESVEGETCHVLTVDELQDTDLYGEMSGEGFEPERLTLLVDTDDYLIRGMRVQGTATMQGQPRDVTTEVRMLDYREVEGVVHPFRMEVSTEGLGAQMTEQQRQQMRQAMEQMENMPEEQRQMMERMMGDRLEQMEQMLASGAVDFTMTVKEIRVNEGPPSGGGGG